MGPLPNENKAKAANKVVKLASTIVEIALWKPDSIASKISRPDLNSSLILSKIKTFASTAIPIVNTIPAIPGKVRVACNRLNNAKIKIILQNNAILAKTPKTPYVISIKIITAIKPAILAILPDEIESLPSPGPTDLSSNIIIGAGKAPDLKTNAKSLVSWTLNEPVIWPVENIWDCITGALTTLLSKTIAKGLPIFSPVTLPNFFTSQRRKLERNWRTIISIESWTCIL